MFGRKRIVDLTKFKEGGVVRVPKNKDVVPENSDGFVDIRSKVMSRGNAANLFYGKSMVKKDTFSTEAEGYNKREVDAKITELDNKIYKLEQRIELLEKKLGVNQPVYSSNTSPLANW